MHGPMTFTSERQRRNHASNRTVSFAPVTPVESDHNRYTLAATAYSLFLDFNIGANFRDRDKQSLFDQPVT